MLKLKNILNFLGDSNEKALKQYWPIVKEIDSLEADLEELTAEELKSTTQALRTRLGNGERVDDLIPEAFAAVREAAKRALGQRHFPAQAIGGIVLHEGKIAEMKTGEGKTLVATMPVYLHALTGKGVHVVTVNDYLARRDTQWMGPIYNMLGLSIACLQHEISYIYDPDASISNPDQANLRQVYRKEAYDADITYGTNNEFGFDYLRDNMVAESSKKVQRELSYAIVDEVDNILIDEARTPLIISGPAQQPIQIYSRLAKLVPRLEVEIDYTIDQRYRAVNLTEVGMSRMEQLLNVSNLYDSSNYELTHYIENALRAIALYQRDREYVLRDGLVVLVDDFTGRLMPGRRLADGLHQAIEAKEGVKVQQESITYASITLQNYFRMYKKLAGMTGTAITEAEEFWKIYKLDVVMVPTNKPMIREDQGDYVFATEGGKFAAIVKEIAVLQQQGRPILVGTTSIEKSEQLSKMLKDAGVSHQVLNAKQHEHEATVVAQAGRPSSVTVATNMAGRGTDIVLGGNPQSLGLEPKAWQEGHDSVVALGGLHIIGTERHESRRIDNQLRGRAGRQGDPGTSRFYVSLEDDLMKRFGGERIKGIMAWAGLGDETPLEHGLVSKTVEGSQSKIEAHNFDIRKHLVEYDDVVNRHREIIYAERGKILSDPNLKVSILEFVEQELLELTTSHLSSRDPYGWDLDAFQSELNTLFPSLPDHLKSNHIVEMDRDEIEKELIDYAQLLYVEQEKAIGEEDMRTLERLVMLRIIDSLWIQHLTSMENLRQGIGLHAVGQRDPLTMYKKEGHQKFTELLARIQHDLAHTIFRVSMTKRNSNRNNGSPQSKQAFGKSGRETPVSQVGARKTETIGVTGRKLGRNEMCLCGSGKKYKKCHGS